MKAIEKGQKFEFTPTGVVFEVANVTETRISWYVGFNFKGGNGINNLKMAWSSMKSFQDGVERGIYKIN